MTQKTLRATNVVICPTTHNNKIIIPVNTKSSYNHLPVYKTRFTLTASIPDSITFTIPDILETIIKKVLFFLSALMYALITGARSLCATARYISQRLVQLALALETISYMILFGWLCWLTGKGVVLCFGDAVAR
jgi:hypothetical protein